MTGDYSISETDLALPAPGFSWVIGRTYRFRSESGQTGYSGAGGFQGRNWFQTSQPELQVINGESRIRIVYGADRFIEFGEPTDAAGPLTEPPTPTKAWRGINGAAGVVVRSVDLSSPQNPIEVLTYIDQNGATTTFFGVGTSVPATKRGQLWKFADAGGHVAFVGDELNAVAALNAGYDDQGRIQVAYDGSGPGLGRRKYEYVYSAGNIGGVKRLQAVVASTRIAASGTNQWREIARVAYSYWPDGGLPGASESFARPGDLIGVMVRVETSAKTNVGEPVWSVSRKHYRYTAAGEGSAQNVGRLALVLGFEGSRRFHFSNGGAVEVAEVAWAELPEQVRLPQGNAPVIPPAIGAATTAALEPYADAGLEYGLTGRVATAFFGGQCDCSSGASGVHEFFYEDRLGEPSSLAEQATAPWHRCIIKTPSVADGTVGGGSVEHAYQISYMNWLGQPLSSVTVQKSASALIADNYAKPQGNEARKWWARGIVRDAAGRVVSEHSCDNVNSYQHVDGSANAPNWGRLVFEESEGLVTRLERLPAVGAPVGSGEPDAPASAIAEGFVYAVRHSEGASASRPTFVAGSVEHNTDALKLTIALGTNSVTVNRPVITKSRTHRGPADGSLWAPNWVRLGTNIEGETETIYAGYDAGTLWTAPLVPQLTTLKAPVVSTENNGSGAPVTSYSHFDQAGRLRLTESVDGRITRRSYDGVTGQVTLVEYDIATPPGTYGGRPFVSSAADGRALEINTGYTYDAIGRLRTVTTPSSTLGTQTSFTSYARTIDHRLTTISVPLAVPDGSQTVFAAGTKFYGPGSLTIENHAGRVEFSGTVGVLDASGETKWHTPVVETARPTLLDKMMPHALVSPDEWVDFAATPPEGDRNLLGFRVLRESPPGDAASRLSLRSTSVNLFNNTGQRLDESRSYFHQARAVNANATVRGRHSAYDASIFTYDGSGRLRSSESQTSDVTTYTHDVLGRVLEIRQGMRVPAGIPGVPQTSGTPPNTVEERFFKIAEFRYDMPELGPVGLASPSESTQFSQTSWTATPSERKQTTLRDFRGVPFASVGPTLWSEHPVVGLDYRGRPRALALVVPPEPLTADRSPLISSLAGGIERTFDGTNPGFGGAAFAPESISRFEYDELGRQFRTTHANLYKGGGTAVLERTDRPVVEQRWFNEVGKVAMVAGATVEQFQYDRACRLEIRFELASVPPSSASSYSVVVGTPGAGGVIARQEAFIYDQKSGALEATMSLDAWPRGSTSSAGCSIDQWNFPLEPIVDPRTLMLDGTLPTSARTLKWPESTGGWLIGFPRARVFERDYLDRPVRTVEAKLPDFNGGGAPVPSGGWNGLELPSREYDDFFKSPKLQRTLKDELQNFKWYDEFGRSVATFGPQLTGEIIDYDLDGSEGDYEGLNMMIPPLGPCDELPWYMRKRVRTDAGRVVRVDKFMIPEGGMLTPAEIRAMEFTDRLLRGDIPFQDDTFLMFPLAPDGYDLDGKPLFGHKPYAEWGPHNQNESDFAIPSGGMFPPDRFYYDTFGRLIRVTYEDGSRKEIYPDDGGLMERERWKEMFPPDFPDHHRESPDSGGTQIEYEILPDGEIRIKHKNVLLSATEPFTVGGITINPGFGFEDSGSTNITLTPGGATAPNNGDPWFPPDFPALRHERQLWPRPIPATGTEVPLMPTQVRRRDTVLPGGLGNLNIFNVANGPVVYNPTPSDLHVLPMPGNMHGPTGPGPQCFQTPMAIPGGGLMMPPSGFEGSIDTSIGRIGMLSIYPTDSTTPPPLTNVPAEMLVPGGSKPVARYGGWLGEYPGPWTEIPGPNILSPGYDPFEPRPVPDLTPNRPEFWPQIPEDLQPLQTDPTKHFAPYKPNERMLDPYYRPIHREWWTREDARNLVSSGAGAPSPLFHEEWARDPMSGTPKVISLASYPQETLLRKPGCEQEKEEKIYWLCGSTGSASATAAGMSSNDMEEPLWASTELEHAAIQPSSGSFITRETEQFNISRQGNWSTYARHRGRVFGGSHPPEGSGGERVLEFGGPRSGGEAWYSTEQLNTTAAPGENSVTNRGGDNRMFEAMAFRGDAPGTQILPKYSRGGLLLNDGERFSYRYDALKRLVQVDRDLSLPHWATLGFTLVSPAAEPAVRLRPFAKYTYDALGRRVSATYDDNNNGSFLDESVEFFIHDEQWRVVATYRQAPAPAYVPEPVIPPATTPVYGPTNPRPQLGTQRPHALLYERYVYHARGTDGVSDVQGADQPILRQRFRYFRTDEIQVPVLDPETGQPTGQTNSVDVEVECFAPGMNGAVVDPLTAYTRIKQETVYYIQSLRGDVVSLISEEAPDGSQSARGDQMPLGSLGARVIETVRYTSFGVPRVYKRYGCDIVDDGGTPLIRGVTQDPLSVNGGVTEADYNFFFTHFFDGTSPLQWACDIADDSGVMLQDGASVFGNALNGVNEGDYNAFFREFFNGGELIPSSEWGTLSYPDVNNRIGYAGYWWDERVNMYVVRNRWYTPRTGRWLTPDPIGYAGGRNLFEYVGSRPFDFTDPMGLTAVGDFFRKIGWRSGGDGADELYDLFSGEAQAQDAAWEANMRKAYADCIKDVQAQAVANGECETDAKCKCEPLRQAINDTVGKLREIREDQWNAIGDTARDAAVATVAVVAAPATLFGQVSFNAAGNAGLEMLYGGDSLGAAEDGAMNGLMGWGVGKVLRHVFKAAAPSGLFRRSLFYNDKPFRGGISRPYWKENGPANGRSIHHWLFPQRAKSIPNGIRNADFNLMIMPSVPGFKKPFGGFNQWIGMTKSPWGRRIENAIRVVIPGSLGGAWYLGTRIEEWMFSTE